MSFLAISTGLAVLAILGLIVGLVVLLVVIILLTNVLKPARQISLHAREAPEVAPFLTNGVQGVDELRRTSELSSRVPALALAYLDKLQGAAAAAPPSGAPGPSPAPHPTGRNPTGRISGGKP